MESDGESQVITMIANLVGIGRVGEQFRCHPIESAAIGVHIVDEIVDRMREIKIVYLNDAVETNQYTENNILVGLTVTLNQANSDIRYLRDLRSR